VRLQRFTLVVEDRGRLPFEFLFSLVRIINLLGPRELFGFFSQLLNGIFGLVVLRLLLKRLVACFVKRLVFLIWRLKNWTLVLPNWLLEVLMLWGLISCFFWV
jgi:hypothetical protein